jgi:hypothetical protein
LIFQFAFCPSFLSASQSCLERTRLLDGHLKPSEIPLYLKREESSTAATRLSSRI